MEKYIAGKIIKKNVG